MPATVQRPVASDLLDQTLQLQRMRSYFDRPDDSDGLGCDECLHARDDVVLDALACAGLKLVRDQGPTASRAFIERAAD